MIPKSSAPARIAANRDVFDFTFSEAEMTALAELDDDDRLRPIACGGWGETLGMVFSVLQIVAPVFVIIAAG